MGNICSTDYKIISDKKTINTIKSMIDYFRQNPIYGHIEHHGNLRLEDIIEFFGISSDKADCEGELIYDYSYTSEEITLITETNWNIKPDAILMFSLIGDCQFGYQGIETGCGLCLNDGEIYDNEWYFDNDFYDEFPDTKTLRENLCEILATNKVSVHKGDSIKTLIYKYDKNINDGYHYGFWGIHHFDTCSIYDLTGSMFFRKAKECLSKRKNLIQTYVVSYTKDGIKYKNPVGVSDQERFDRSIKRLEAAGYVVTDIVRVNDITPFEVWQEERCREKSCMFFSSGREMLDVLMKDVDLYNPEYGIYAFRYNEEGSIAYYYISPDDADILDGKVQEIGDGYWAEHLGRGGFIVDDPSHENYMPGDLSNLDWCNSRYCIGEWVDTKQWQQYRKVHGVGVETPEEELPYLGRSR